MIRLISLGFNLTFKQTMSLEASVTNFVEIDDELKRISEESKVLRKNKASLEEEITSHMVQNEIGEIFTKNSKVKIFKRKSTKSAYNKAGVFECAELLFGRDRATKLIAMIEDKKDITESVGLKRSVKLT